MSVTRNLALVLIMVLVASAPVFGKTKGSGKRKPSGTSFLYVFGYETPEIRFHNQQFDDEDEVTGAVFIIANDEAAAIAWGHEISEWFVRKLFADPKESWKKDRFASWIEHKPGTIEAAKKMKPPAPTVKQGEYPNFDQMRPRP